MKKFTLSIGVLLLGSVFFSAGSMFSACSSSSNVTPTGAAGTTGAAGSTTGAAGTGAAGSTTGTAGTGSTNKDGSADGYSATTPDGRCVIGAFVRDGACMCQGDNPNVCSMGCTNLQTDNDNCGSCDTKCGATSACLKGTCTAAPVNTVPAAAGCIKMVGSREYSLSIAVANGNIYWADAGHGTVKSQPVAGGAVTMIASGEMAPHMLAIAGTTPVWISSVAGPKGDGGLEVITSTLRKAGAAGAAATTLATGMNEAGGIQGLVPSADGMTIYFSSNTAINSVPLAGGTVTNVGNEDHGGLPGALALDGMKLAYPTGQNGDVDIMTIMAGTVASCGINNAAGELDPAKQINCLRVARSQGSLVLGTMAAKANRAYWADGTNLKANATTAGAPQANETVAMSSGTEIKSLVLSTDKVYFVHDDVVERSATAADSTAETLARGQKAPVSVAVDATKVYFGNSGDCTINSTGL
jgi:hypothetical protein